MNYRKPIISVLGHVDHGKTELLDTINKTKTEEFGEITQNIKVTDMSKETINKYISKQKDIKIPGILWIDTPGHNSFTQSRRKGSQFADLSVLVIDINKGIQPQTEEALNILKESQTPFIISLNKIDKLPGWKGSFEDSGKKFHEELQESVYEIAGSLYDFGFNANLYNKVNNFSNTIAIVPISALQDNGIGNLCEVILGLSQEFLKNQLNAKNKNMRAKVLDITRNKGFGTVADILIYSGEISVNDRIFINSYKGSFKTSINKILKRKNNDYNTVNNLKATDFGSVVVKDSSELTQSSVISNKQEDVDISNQIDSITDDSGIIVSTNTVDKLIPIIKEFQSNGYNVYSGSIGNITKFDVIESSTMNKEYNRCVVGFNVKPTKNALEFARDQNIKLIDGSVIHDIIDDYSDFYNTIQRQKSISLDETELPCKMRIIPDHIFNKGEPAIVGVEIIRGILRKNSILRRKNNDEVGKVKNIKCENNEVNEIGSNNRSSIEIENCKVGRDIFEGDQLFVIPPKEINNEVINSSEFDNKMKEFAENINEKTYNNF